MNWLEWTNDWPGKCVQVSVAEAVLACKLFPLIVLWLILSYVYR